MAVENPGRSGWRCQTKVKRGETWQCAFYADFALAWKTELLSLLLALTAGQDRSLGRNSASSSFRFD